MSPKKKEEAEQPQEKAGRRWGRGVKNPAQRTSARFVPRFRRRGVPWGSSDGTLADTL